MPAFIETNESDNPFHVVRIGIAGGRLMHETRLFNDTGFIRVLTFARTAPDGGGTIVGVIDPDTLTLKQAHRFSSTLVTFTGGVAIAPTIQRDVKKGVTSVLIPVYFLKDAKGAPIGGLRGSWRSDTKAATLSLFIGAAFQLSAAQQ